MTVQNPDVAVLKARWLLNDASDATVLAQSVEDTGWDDTDVPGITIYPGEEDADVPARIEAPGGDYGRRFHADQYYGDPWPVSPHFCQQLLAQQRYGPGSYYPDYAEPFNPPCWGDILNTDQTYAFWFRRHTKCSGPVIGFGAMYTMGYSTPLWGSSFPTNVIYFGDSQDLCWGIDGVSNVSTRAGGIETGNDYDDGEWHQVVVRAMVDENSELAWPVRIELVIDGALVATWYTPAEESWTNGVLSNWAVPLFVGGGQLYKSGRDTQLPDVSSSTPINGCGCDVYDIRIYCGALTDEEIFTTSAVTGANLLVFSGGLTVA